MPTQDAFRRGDAGAAVAEIRDRLARLGLFDPELETDPAFADTFDSRVDAAVRHFQQEQGLTVTASSVRRPTGASTRRAGAWATAC